jgi:hypothetical protein
VTIGAFSDFGEGRLPDHVGPKRVGKMMAAGLSVSDQLSARVWDAECGFGST